MSDMTYQIKKSEKTEIGGECFCYKMIYNFTKGYGFIVESGNRLAVFAGVTQKEGPARRLFKKLKDNTVTPIDAEFIIDEFFSR